MTDKEIRAARLRLLDERLNTIRIRQRGLLDSLEANRSAGSHYTKWRAAEVNELEFEKKLLETERVNLLEEK